MNQVQERLAAIRGLKPLPEAARAGLDIRVITEGGYLEYQNQTWVVRRVFRYLDVKWKNFSRRKTNYWVTELELFSLDSGEKIFVEWEYDDKLEVYVTTQVARLRDIQYDGAPIKFADLLEIAEEEEGEVVFNGQRFHYSEDDTWAALFFQSDKTPADDQLGDGVPVRLFEFEGDGEAGLTIEAWETDPEEKPEREAFVSEPASQRAFKVLQLSQ